MPRKPAWSLSVRLGWRLAAVTLLAVLLASAAVAWRAIATVHELDDSALQSQARLIAAHLPDPLDKTGRIILSDELLAPFIGSDGDNVFLVYDRERQVATSDTQAATALAPLLPRPVRGGFFRLPPLAGHEHGMVGLIERSGPWRIVVLQGREQTAVLLDSLIGNFLLAALWLLLPIGLAMTLVGVLTLRSGLRPLRDVSAAAALVGPARPGARLPAAALPSEIAPLVHAVNDALSRLEQAMLAQRHFMAEAAHALRTPLAVLTARLDMLDELPDATALRHDTDRIARLVGQLLGMARLEGTPLDVTRPADLRAVATEAISLLVPLGLRGGVDIALLGESPTLPVRGNHAALVLAVTNLIENALRFAPAGSVVEVVIGPSATVSVLDRGPGVPVEHRQRIFERFERGGTPSGGGSGLGLAIVAEIAAAHGGMAQASERLGGGAEFTFGIGQTGDCRLSHPG